MRMNEANAKNATSAEPGGNSISERKKQANRRNAQRSTGPKTTRGKSISRLNSLKHGLLARTVPIRNFPILQISEQKDLEEILSDLNLELCPEGRIEAMLVERIANCYFQLSRVARCQTAHVEIAMRKEFFDPSVDLGDRQEQLRAKAKFHQNMSEVVKTTIEILETDHGLDVVPMARLGRVIVNPDHAFRLSSLNDRLRESKGEANKQTDSSVEKLEEEFLRTLHLALSELRDMSEGLESWNNGLQYARFNQHLVPEEGVLRKLQRYDSMLDRQLHRALDRLEHLQRRRQTT